MKTTLLGWLEKRFNLTEMFSFLTNFGLFPAELDTNKPLREAVSEALSRPMPSYAKWPRVLGILSVILFLFLGLTGVMLAFYYEPTPDAAYESVTTVVRDVGFGWFVHQIHGWAAQAFLLVLLLRVFRFFFQGLYKTPREGLWVIAIITFLVATHSDLTGRVLGWDADGYWSTVRALEIFYGLPVLGPMFRYLVGGGLDALVLVRFYFLHVVVLPGMILALLFLNFSGVRRIGLSDIPGDDRSGPAVYRVYLTNLAILIVVIFGVLVTLATLIPDPFIEIADPFHTPPGSRPPWYLLASHGFLESFPSVVPRWMRSLLLEMILLVCILVPVIDRSSGRKLSERKLTVYLGAAVVLTWLVFSWYGYQLEAAP